MDQVSARRKQREAISEDQIRAWIVARIRQDPRYRGFAEPFEIVPRYQSALLEPSWVIGSLSIEDWSPDSFVAFERAATEAQQRFDLK